MTRIHPGITCLACRYRLDAATNIRHGPVMPRPGQFTLCARCGEVHVYAAHPLLDTIIVREPTLDELERFARDPVAVAVVHALHRAWARRV